MWPDVDFEWYANVGKPVATTVVAYPAPRDRYGYLIATRPESYPVGPTLR